MKNSNLGLFYDTCMPYQPPAGRCTPVHPLYAPIIAATIITLAATLLPWRARGHVMLCYHPGHTRVVDGTPGRGHPAGCTAGRRLSNDVVVALVREVCQDLDQIFKNKPADLNPAEILLNSGTAVTLMGLTGAPELIEWPSWRPAWLRHGYGPR